MKAKKGYLKGMVQDITSTKVGDDTYFDLKNFRVITDEGSSSGSLENEKGHSLGFEIPNIPETTYTYKGVSFTIPAQNNLRIVGWAVINDTIVVATTNETGANPVASVSQLWKFTYNEDDNSIPGTTGNILDPAIHLIYNNVLNFSTNHRVKIVGRYENVDTIRIYTTDYNSSIKTFNIADPNLIYTPPEFLDLTADVNLNQPVLWEVGSGFLPEGISFQAGYRLLSSTAGAVSLYSPPTPVLPIPNASFTNTTVDQFSGEFTANTNTKSVTVKFQELDNRYDVIEFIAIIHSALGVATVYKVGEAQIPQSRYIDYVYDSIATAEIIPLPLYNILSSGFEVAKDIEIKDNFLLAANTKSSSGIIDFDARAYRFNNIRKGVIKDVSENVDLEIDGITKNTIELPSLNPIGTWVNIPEEHDAINGYNDDSQDYTDWRANQQYKYQADGTTLGGEGPNVKYKFITQGMIAINPDRIIGTSTPDGNTITQDPPHINITKGGAGQVINKNIQINAAGDIQEYNLDSHFLNNASFTFHSYFAGHTRGEVYRYGICFHNKKGSTNFVNWIGDIRMPEINEPMTNGFPIMNNQDNLFGSGASAFPWLQNLGLEFTINVASIASEISGFSIVRVLRDANNRSRLGTGILMWLETRLTNDTTFGVVTDYGTGVGSGNYEHDLWSAFRKSKLQNTDRSTVSKYQISGASERTYFIPRETPGFGSAANVPGDLNKKCLTYLVSPIGREINIISRDGDYIRTTAYYNGKNHQFGQINESDQNADKLGFIYRLNHSQNTAGYSVADETAVHGLELLQIRKGQRLQPAALFSGEIANLLSTDYGLADPAANIGLTVESGIGLNFNVWTPFGLGAEKMFLLLEKNAPIKSWFRNPTTDGVYLYNHEDDLEFNDIGGPASTHRLPRWEVAQGINSGYVSTTSSPFKEIQYCRYIANQYGGNTFAIRSTDRYYFIGHFQPFIEGKTNYVNRVFDGDTYLNYYDQEITVPYTDVSENTNGAFNPPDPGKNVLTTVIMAPVESTINLEFGRVQKFAKKRFSNELSPTTAFTYSRVDYASVYLSYDFVTTKYFSQDFLLGLQNEHPNRVWASNSKINGELSDSWRMFEAFNYREVDGALGPINKLINWRGEVYYYQDRGVGKLLINERALINDSSGQQLTLGTGNGLQDHSYISTETGSVHQYGVVGSLRALYHYDARLKKMFRLGGNGLEALSDVKYMSSFFGNNVIGDVTKIDKTLDELNSYPIGVEAVVDYRYNRVIFTFLGNLNFPQWQPNTYYTENQIIESGGVFYNTDSDYTSTAVLGDDIRDGLLTVINTNNPGYTITFNEFLDNYEAFYDFIPGIYLQYGRRLISRSPFSPNKGYVHNIGEYCDFYGQGKYKSYITTVLGTQGESVKLFNNIEYYNQITANNVDVPLETFGKIRVYNDYQNTGLLSIGAGNTRRRMRSWKHTIQRDTNNNSKARIRNHWAKLYLEYPNNNNKRHIIHDIIYSYVPTSM